MPQHGKRPAHGQDHRVKGDAETENEQVIDEFGTLLDHVASIHVRRVLLTLRVRIHLAERDEYILLLSPPPKVTQVAGEGQDGLASRSGIEQDFLKKNRIS